MGKLKNGLGSHVRVLDNVPQRGKNGHPDTETKTPKMVKLKNVLGSHVRVLGVLDNVPHRDKNGHPENGKTKKLKKRGNC